MGTKPYWLEPPIGPGSCVKLLSTLIKRNGTDLLLSVGQPPQLRVSKELTSLDYAPLTPEMTKTLVYQIMNESQRREFETSLEMDFSFGLDNGERFRVNAFMQRGTVAAAFRLIPFQIKTFKELGLPPIVEALADNPPNGLVLVTGPAGCGKSTTLAAMINHINQTRRAHIITIEDPIEYFYQSNQCTIEQREIHSDTKTFESALKNILRQDPDVVLLGEMRDLESITAALTIAETGHLFLTTLHTNSCAQTISRIVDVFPGDKQAQVRTQLAMCLNSVMAQVLLPKIGGGLYPAVEIMIATQAVRSVIRENRIQNLDNFIQMGASFGMQTMNQSLAAAVKSGKVKEDDAQAASIDKDDFYKCLHA